MEMSPKAKAFWERIPADIRVRLLNNVYCTQCKGSTGITQVKGTIEKRDLILRGYCTRCGNEVARLIESE